MGQGVHDGLAQLEGLQLVLDDVVGLLLVKDALGLFLASCQTLLLYKTSLFKLKSYLSRPASEARSRSPVSPSWPGTFGSGRLGGRSCRRAAGSSGRSRLKSGLESSRCIGTSIGTRFVGWPFGCYSGFPVVSRTVHLQEG